MSTSLQLVLDPSTGQLLFLPIPAGGGGGTPASPDTSIQFNNAGSFGGFGSWDGSVMSVTGTGTFAALSATTGQVSSGIADQASGVNLLLENAAFGGAAILAVQDNGALNFNSATSYVFDNTVNLNTTPSGPNVIDVTSPSLAGTWTNPSPGEFAHAAGDDQAMSLPITVVNNLAYMISVNQTAGTAGFATVSLNGQGVLYIDGASGAIVTSNRFISSSGGVDNLVFTPSIDYDGTFDSVVSQSIQDEVVTGSNLTINGLGYFNGINVINSSIFAGSFPSDDPSNFAAQSVAYLAPGVIGAQSPVFASTTNSGYFNVSTNGNAGVDLFAAGSAASTLFRFGASDGVSSYIAQMAFDLTQVLAWSGALSYTFDNALTFASSQLPSTTVSFTNGAAANAGTLTNAPAAGDPTKWIPIDDNGTTRYIPAW